MPIFEYEAVDQQGKKVTGTLDAKDKGDAKQQLQAEGLFPSGLRESTGGGDGDGVIAKPRKKGGGFGVSVKELTNFTVQLATLIDAGLPIVRSLRVLEGQLKAGLLKTTVGAVAEDVEGGSPLSDAMGKHPKVFDRLYMNMVKAGEIGGVLDQILNRLAEFMDKSYHLRKKVIGAMIYPAAVITFAVSVVIVLLIFIVPRFEKLFREMRLELPQVTKVLIGVSRWLLDNSYWLPLVIIALFVIGIFLKRVPKIAMLIDGFKLRVPLFGTIARKAVIARFSRTLGTLTQAGVGIIDALEICQGTSNNAVVAEAIEGIKDSVREGESIAGPMSQARVFDDVVVNMVDVGEETGELDRMLLKVGDTYDKDVEVAVDSMVSLLEPLLIIVVGGIVFFIVLALFLPLTKMLQELGN
ncbi:MAG: type II secretion system F family protein [Planctomycetota bacterium]|jgi:type IV pilus assembly protein PilC